MSDLIERLRRDPTWIAQEAAAALAAKDAEIARLTAERDARIEPDVVESLIRASEPMLSDALCATETADEKAEAELAERDAEIAKLRKENERLRRTVVAAAKLGRILGFLGDDEARISAFLDECGPELIERARAALTGEDWE